MRVLTVIAEMGSGGAESVTAQLAGVWTAQGHHVVVATAGGWRSDQLRVRGVPVVPVPLRSAGALAQVRSAWRVGRELRRRPVDLVHAHNVRAAFAARVGSLLAGSRAPVLCTVHGLAPDRYRLAARVLRRCADGVGAVSGAVAERLGAAGLAPTSTWTVPNAADLEHVADDRHLESPRAARERLGLPREGPVVLCVARLARPKRHDLLLEAWRERPDLGLLVIAGDGPDRAALERRAADLGVADRCVWLGDRHDVGRLLAAADVLVLASDREGLPVSVLEAMAAGVPVVASAVGGLRDLPAGAVRLVPAGSAAALGRAVADLLGDSAARGTQAGEARELAEARYSRAAMAEGYARVLREWRPRPRLRAGRPPIARVLVPPRFEERDEGKE